MSWDSSVYLGWKKKMRKKKGTIKFLNNEGNAK
jgi:hypothetical protein